MMDQKQPIPSNSDFQEAKPVFLDDETLDKVNGGVNPMPPVEASNLLGSNKPDLLDANQPADPANLRFI